MFKSKHTCQIWFILGVKVCENGLMEQPWLQLICYTICLLHGCNFR